MITHHIIAKIFSYCSILNLATCTLPSNCPQVVDIPASCAICVYLPHTVIAIHTHPFPVASHYKQHVALPVTFSLEFFDLKSENRHWSAHSIALQGISRGLNGQFLSYIKILLVPLRIFLTKSFLVICVRLLLHQLFTSI